MLVAGRPHVVCDRPLLWSRLVCTSDGRREKQEGPSVQDIPDRDGEGGEVGRRHRHWMEFKVCTRMCAGVCVCIPWSKCSTVTFPLQYGCTQLNCRLCLLSRDVYYHLSRCTRPLDNISLWIYLSPVFTPLSRKNLSQMFETCWFPVSLSFPFWFILFAH